MTTETPAALLLRLADEIHAAGVENFENRNVVGPARLYRFADRIREIASSLEGQAEDAARLEWISANCFVNEYEGLPSLRTAIDSARAAQQESES